MQDAESLSSFPSRLEFLYCYTGLVTIELVVQQTKHTVVWFCLRQPHYVTQAGLETVVSLPPTCYDRDVPPHSLDGPPLLMLLEKQGWYPVMPKTP